MSDEEEDLGASTPDIEAVEAERKLLIQSIKWLGQHLPETAVSFLIDEIEEENEDGFEDESQSGGIIASGTPNVISFLDIQIDTNQSTSPTVEPAAAENRGGNYQDQSNSALEQQTSNQVQDVNGYSQQEQQAYAEGGEYQDYYQEGHSTNEQQANQENADQYYAEGDYTQGQYDENGNYQYSEYEGGYYDENGNYVETPYTEGEYNNNGEWQPSEGEQGQNNQGDGYADGTYQTYSEGQYAEGEYQDGQYTDADYQNAAVDVNYTKNANYEMYPEGQYDYDYYGQNQEGNPSSELPEGQHLPNAGDYSNEEYQYDNGDHYGEVYCENNNPMEEAQPEETAVAKDGADENEQDPQTDDSNEAPTPENSNSQQEVEHQNDNRDGKESKNTNDNTTSSKSKKTKKVFIALSDVGKSQSKMDRRHSSDTHVKKEEERRAFFLPPRQASMPNLGATTDDVSDIHTSGSVDTNDLDDAVGPKTNSVAFGVAIEPRKSRKFRSQSIKHPNASLEVDLDDDEDQDDSDEPTAVVGATNSDDQNDEWLDNEDESGEEDSEEDGMPPAYRYDCALLMVDISGFTKLSRNLQVEALSKTINAYFQMIVTEVENFGGDILKFAGDAVFCEWPATTGDIVADGGTGDEDDDEDESKSNREGPAKPWHGLSPEECVFTASACGARIVDKCSDYPVYKDGQLFSHLNVHCSVAYGEVAGLHVGDFQTRMEYLILGEPIDQVAGAIDIAGHGEIVASPQALKLLKLTADMDPELNADATEPQVIASRSSCYFRPKGSDQVQKDFSVNLQNELSPRERLAKRCLDLDFAGLKRLRTRMCHYIHPVVVNDELAEKAHDKDEDRAELRHRSEAELRTVCTIFIMPKINCKLTGEDEEDSEVIVLLNDIMLLVLDELNRYKGHLRQYIVDDKGVVLIANFGLRGSTFPAMVEQRAIPFATYVHNMLKDELNVDNRIGATFNKVYCGVVGGVRRHEYAVLGPSVNLAARLMANKGNRGFLVDECVRKRAPNLTFRSLPPVKAKGYDNLVPIFEPLTDPDPDDVWPSSLGGKVEREKLFSISEAIADGVQSARVVAAKFDTEKGQRSFSIFATQFIGSVCVVKAIPYVNIRIASSGSICTRIIPFLFLGILEAINDISDIDYVERLVPNDGERFQDYLTKTLGSSRVPDEQHEKLLGITLGEGGSGDKDDDVEPDVMDSLVELYTMLSTYFDLVLFTLENCGCMDKASQSFLKQLILRSSKILVLVPVSQPSDESDASAVLKTIVDNQQQKIADIKITRMLQRNLEGRSKEQENTPPDSVETFVQFVAASSRDIHEQTEGGKASKENNGLCKHVANIDAGNVSELILSRIDALPTDVRKALFAGAILGSGFDLLDIVIVLEKGSEIKQEERLEHARSVKERLDQAVEMAILEITEDNDNAYHGSFKVTGHPFVNENVRYKFAFDVWRSHMLTSTLDAWKKEMHGSIAEAIEESLGENEEDGDFEALARLFSHLKESGDVAKAGGIALRLGCKMESQGLLEEATMIYTEARNAWKSLDNGDPDGDHVGGLSLGLLEGLEGKDFDYLIKLSIAIGRCNANILDGEESKKAYQTALSLVQKMPKSVKLEDSNIIFPILNGLFVARRFDSIDRIEDEQGIVNISMKKALDSKSPVHISHSLSMKAEMLARHGNFTDAFEAVAELRRVYDAGEHSNTLSTIYGCDYPSQCIAQSAMWAMHIGDRDEALHIVKTVCKEFLPRIDPSNVNSLFQVLYPTVWVLKNNNLAIDAREVFDQYVVQNAAKWHERGGVTYGKPLHSPIMALLDLATLRCYTKSLPDYIKWAVKEEFGMFGPELNFLTGYFGRTADSITAEICLLLSYYTDDPETSRRLIEKGSRLAREAEGLIRPEEGRSGMIIAYGQLSPLLTELNEVASYQSQSLDHSLTLLNLEN